MDWQARLRGLALAADFGDFALLYLPSVRPPVPPEYEVPGIVAVTFRLQRRPTGGHVYATLLDVAAAVRLGERLGLGPAEAIAAVDSHERVHIALQLEGVAEAVEEAQSQFVDGVWLSLRDPRAARHVRAGPFGVVRSVGPGLWAAVSGPPERGADGAPAPPPR